MGLQNFTIFVQRMDMLTVMLRSAASLGQLKVKNLSMTADSAENLLYWLLNTHCLREVASTALAAKCVHPDRTV